MQDVQQSGVFEGPSTVHLPAGSGTEILKGRKMRWLVDRPWGTRIKSPGQNPVRMHVWPQPVL